MRPGKHYELYLVGTYLPIRGHTKRQAEACWVVLVLILPSPVNTLVSNPVQPYPRYLPFNVSPTCIYSVPEQKELSLKSTYLPRAPGFVPKKHTLHLHSSSQLLMAVKLVEQRTLQQVGTLYIFYIYSFRIPTGRGHVSTLYFAMYLNNNES